MTYKVGRGRPPREWQYKKGQSGNPRGRPKGSGTLPKAVLAELSKKMTITENGKTRSVTKLQALCLSISNSGIQGNMKAAELLLLYLSKLEQAGPKATAPPTLSAADKKAVEQYLSDEVDSLVQARGAPSDE